MKNDHGYLKCHTSLNSAKRYCSKTPNCFGISVSSNSPPMLCSMGFPIELTKNGKYDVHKKEIVSGNFNL